MKPSLNVRLVAEFAGTAFLVAAVVGSGIMAERLAGGNVAVALLANTIATGAILVALILSLASISGAHLNPAVSICDVWQGGLPWSEAIVYMIAQSAGGIFGAMLAHAMFGLSLLTTSLHARGGGAQWLSEFVATFGLLAVIQGASRSDTKAVPWAVACYVTAAYWFTASTSFANPAVTIARSLSDTFAGIRPVDVPLFVSAQITGALSATLLLRRLAPRLPPVATEVAAAD
jgi:glycerol uptake facilitator-like aquaporin